MNREPEREGSWTKLRRTLGRYAAKLLGVDNHAQGIDLRAPKYAPWIRRHLAAERTSRSDPLFDQLFQAVVRDTKDILVRDGMEPGAAEVVARQRGSLEMLVAIRGLPTDGLTDQELNAIGIRTEPAEIQVPGYRLVELPKGWKMRVSDLDINDLNTNGFVLNDAGVTVLDFDFLASGTDIPRGSVRLHPNEP